MSSSAAVAKRKTIPLVPLLLTLVAVAALLGGFVYLNKPVSGPADVPATPEAKAYLAYLALSDVNMQASENLMNQQVVEVEGKISNNGSREIASIHVYCLFYSVNGHAIHRERLPIIGGPGSKASLKPGDTRSFRLPFDSLPEGWNQAMPKLVIAQITFVK